jgi:hypothetical protein
MALAALFVSIVATLSAAAAAIYVKRQTKLIRHANSLPVLVDLFTEHRGARLAEARKLLYERKGQLDLERGLDQLPQEEAALIRELSWFYDNLGALVAHDIVDLGPISGYLGGAVLENWATLAPIVTVERKLRSDLADPERYQEYFENLAVLITQLPPGRARTQSAKWRLTPSTHD